MTYDYTAIGLKNNPTGFGHSFARHTQALQALKSVQVLDMSEINKPFEGERLFINMPPKAFTRLIEAGKGFDLENKHVTALFVWESDELPKEFNQVMPFVDTIWTPSNFCYDLFKPLGETKLVNHYTTKFSDSPEQVDEEMFKFLLVFDGGSKVERKNPFAVIRAFKKAFQGRDDVMLVIKTANLGPSIVNELKLMLKDFKHVIVNKYLTEDELSGLYANCDCMVSATKGEGFGLNLLEAMGFGKVVIAPNYSGQTSFMSETNSLLVDYTLTDCDDEFFKGRWAKVCLDDLTDKMKFAANADTLALRTEAFQTALDWSLPRCIKQTKLAL